MPFLPPNQQHQSTEGTALHSNQQRQSTEGTLQEQVDEKSQRATN